MDESNAQDSLCKKRKISLLPANDPLKHKEDDLLWVARFPQASTFKIFMDSINSVMVDCSFQIVDTEDFKGVAVECLDLSQTCLLQGRLSAQVFKSEENTQVFCVRMANIMNSLRSIAPSYFVEMWCLKGSTEVWLQIYEPRVGSHRPTFQICTLDKNNEICCLENTEYDIFVEIDMKILQNTLKTAKDHRAEAITIGVYSQTESENRCVSYFILSYSGDEVKATITVGQSITEIAENDSDGMPLVIKASEPKTLDEKQTPQKTDLKTCFENTFGCQNIMDFIKSLDRQTLTLRLKQDRPLILDYPLGSSISLGDSETRDFLKYIIAPRST